MGRGLKSDFLTLSLSVFLATLTVIAPAYAAQTVVLDPHGAVWGQGATIQIGTSTAVLAQQIQTNVTVGPTWTFFSSATSQWWVTSGWNYVYKNGGFNVSQPASPTTMSINFQVKTSCGVYFNAIAIIVSMVIAFVVMLLFLKLLRGQLRKGASLEQIVETLIALVLAVGAIAIILVPFIVQITTVVFC